MPEACIVVQGVGLQVRLMKKTSRQRHRIGAARDFLHCVIVEHRAATEELKASSQELETLLHDLLASRKELPEILDEDLRDGSDERPVVQARVAPDPAMRSVTQLLRE